MIEDTDNKPDEVINVKLPRADYERLRVVLERERTYSWLTSQIKSTWIWVLAGGVIMFLTLYEKTAGLVGVVK